MNDALCARVAAHHEEMIENTRRLCRINSVKSVPEPGAPFGKGVRDALDAALALAASLGFRTKNLDGYIGYAEWGEGEDSFAVLGHLDVVPAGTGWTYEPFGAEVHDGKIYARGASDNKAPLVTVLYALKSVAECRTASRCRIRIIFGCDEESGWEDIAYYNKHEQMPEIGVSPDACYPVINVEKGICHLAFSAPVPPCADDIVRAFRSGSRPNIVPARAEADVSGVDDLATLAAAFSGATGAEFSVDGSHIVSRGVAAHGAAPDAGKNAAGYLVAFLCTLPLPDTPLSRALRTVEKRIGLTTNGIKMGLDVYDKVSGALTCNLGILDIDGDGMRGALDIRHPISYTAKEMCTVASVALREGGIAVSIADAKKPLYLPEEHPLIQTLLRIYHEQTGMEAYTVAIGGGTYARALKTGVAFGMGLEGTGGSAHEPDEHVTCDGLLVNARIYAHLLDEVAEGKLARGR